jgi:methionine sulfoxide reductase heme-binding subunit
MFFKKKRNIWILCSLPWVLVAIQIFRFGLDSKEFWKWSVAITGYSAAVLLAISLALSPLHKHLPSSQFFAILNRHKREIGLSAFFYAAFHVLSYFVKEYIKNGTIDWFYLLHPVLLPGETALIILSLLALTSYDYWIKRLTWRRWKSLHRTVYIAEAAVFLHMGLQFGVVSIWGCLIFIPLFVCQRLRLQQ